MADAQKNAKRSEVSTSHSSETCVRGSDFMVKAIVDEFKDTILEFHNEVGGRVTAIHDLFNHIALQNKRPPLPPQAVAMLLTLTKDQSKPQPGGPTVEEKQTLNAFANMVEPTDTPESFESKVVSVVCERLRRLQCARKVFPQVKPSLSDLHLKVDGDAGKLYAWFESMLPEDVRSKFSQDAFCAMVMHVPPKSPKIPLDVFLSGIENNMDETDTAEKINEATAKALDALQAAGSGSGSEESPAVEKVQEAMAALDTA